MVESMTQYMKTGIKALERWIFVALLFVTPAVGFSFDTPYSNIQEGVRMKIIGFGEDVPLLRIENSGRLTIAIRNDIYLVISFWDGKQPVKNVPSGPSFGSGPHGEEESKLVTIIAPKTNIEIPLYKFWFKANDASFPLIRWKEGVAQLPKGTHQVHLTTNCRGLTALDLNFTPFRQNFDIPPFDYEIK